jgi:membrane protease YdiL (CAAX protease family)
MLFLLKRTVRGSLTGLLLLATFGFALRHLRGDDATPLHFDLRILLLGVAVCGGILLSDGLIHGGLLLLFGDRYRKKHVELAAVFREQTFQAIVTGALMAGVGEEVVFRGLATNLTYLLPAAVLFGVLHHLRRSLWYLTIWSIWEGVLMALAVHLTGELAVTMVAHFLHDLIGFVIFRLLNQRQQLLMVGITGSDKPQSPG